MLLYSTKKYSLKAICEHYNITPGNHRADGDTDSLMQIYRQLLQELSNELVLDADGFMRIRLLSMSTSTDKYKLNIN